MHFNHLLCPARLHHFITIKYITFNKGGRKLAFENNICIEQKVLSNGAVCWECNQRRTANTCKDKIHVLNDQVIHTQKMFSTDSLEKCLEFGGRGYCIWNIMGGDFAQGDFVWGILS